MKPRDARYDAVVIGAGHNGLVCAAYLARAGLRTLVLERAERIGGATISEEVWPGWTVSAASYVCSLLHPRVIEELELRAYGYDAYLKSPASFTPLLDGRSLLLGRDDAENAREVERFDRRDADGFLAFEAERARLGSALADAFDAPDARDVRFDDATWRTLRGSAAALVERYVRTPVLQAELVNDGLIGTYAGPRDDGTAMVLAYHNAGRAHGVQGAWGFVRGGMGAIAQAAARSAMAAGAEIVSGSPVERILANDRRATGVVLEDGSEIRADIVVSNADPVRTFAQMGAEIAELAPTRRRLATWRIEGVVVKVNLALERLPDFTARPGSTPQSHHRATVHVAPSIDYLQRAHDDARAGGVSRAPLIECFMQTPTEPELVPPGKHVLSIFSQYFPYHRSDRAWSAAAREAAADVIVETLAQYAPTLPDTIIDRQILAPPDLEAKIGLTHGHIFHGELLPDQMFAKRFAARTLLRGLYLCGSGAHPGGCASGIPGRHAAAAVAADVRERHEVPA